MENLTARQEEILNFIKKYIVSNGYPPTVREIGKALNLSSPATIHSHLANLESKGFIRKNEQKNRAIELLVKNEFEQSYDRVIEVPLLGKVTAGNPITAIERPDETFSLPIELVPPRKEVFALEVSGDSMINKHIHDGDIVIVERCKVANNGDIVVAMTSDDEVTLKTFYKDNGYVRLQPENDLYDPIILDNVIILGKAIGLFRKF
jgi:repressor LexA